MTENPKSQTRESLVSDFHKLGLTKGSTVIVHSSLSSLGWVCGGAIALIQALMDVIGPQGNIVMPTHSSDYTEPSKWQNPPVLEGWWGTIRASMPAFDPKITPTRGVGIVPEVFRAFEGVKRSNHPSVSFAAWGAKADWIVDKHPLDNPMGANSPLAKIYDLDGEILLIGVGHRANTSLHLAESLLLTFPKMTQGGPMKDENGEWTWVNYIEPDYQSENFPRYGAEYESTYEIKSLKIGNAEVRLMNQRSIVEFVHAKLKS